MGPGGQQARSPARLVGRRALIDTYQAPVVYMRSDCHVCRAEGFESQARVELNAGSRSVIATVHHVMAPWLRPGEAGLSETAWRALALGDGEVLGIRHPPVLESLRHIRAKVYGMPLDYGKLLGIMRDVAANRLSDLHLASFVTACAGDRMSRDETIALTRAMIDVGERLTWSSGPVIDKHCVGGLPGNRTTLIVVPIVTACGALMPKTSSRAITSPAGTADTMETLAPVSLGLQAMRRVVEREGGCIVWGGNVRLSPADDILIRVERPLDFDSDGQLVASVLSKKIAAGSTHVLIDMPIGPTAKVRSDAYAEHLAARLDTTATMLGLELGVYRSNGTQPVGIGVGPALEARDVLKVLRNDEDAPADLRERAIALAGALLELAPGGIAGTGMARARAALGSGQALAKFLAICEAQGGFREPTRAPFTADVVATKGGRITAIDNRLLARVAKLAGAPVSPAAGLEMALRNGDLVERGQPLFTVHAQSRGELAYALEHAARRLPVDIAKEAP